MLVILGWLGCAYLVVKSLEMFNQQMVNPDRYSLAGIGGVVALTSAIVFAALIVAQAKKFDEVTRGLVQ